MEKSREELLQILIRRIMSIMKYVGRDFIKSEPDLSPPQVRLLLSIGRRVDGISVSELAELNEVTPGAVTQFVNTLVEKNLVSREGDPHDRRIVKLKLTEAARNQFEKLKKEHLVSITRIFGPLSKEDLQRLIDILMKIDTSHIRKES